MEKPTEDTYVGELVSVIKQIGGPLGFDAEINHKTPSGRPDISLYYEEKLVAVIEVKQPGVPLSDPDLKDQAERYAEWYHKNKNICFYGIHNLRYLNVFKYVTKDKREKTLLEFMGTKRSDWTPISDFPFGIMPWVRSINDFKQISANNEAKRNLGEFLLSFKEILEGKSIDLSLEAIQKVRQHIEKGASQSLTKFEDLYRTGEKDVRELFEDWRKERGIQKPKNDNQLREFLNLLLKEQLYTFSMKVLFYLVLQNIDTEMAPKLKQNLASVELSDSGLFKDIFDTLFKYAIERTGDFEEVFGTNTVDRLPIVDQALPSLKELISYLSQIRWSEIKVDIIGRVFEGLIYTERRHLLGQHYTDTMVVDLILAATIRKPGKLIDPGCGSGTFLVRALNYWRANYGAVISNFELVEGIDIDKLGSMLSKVNLYIQALEAIKGKTNYYPRIYHKDFFKAEPTQDYFYVTTNPPYTRQEEMAMAFYDREYKKGLTQAVSDIEDWSNRSSIYAYFLVGGAKLLREGGRLGFVVENSWMNAEYGGPIKKWFLKNFTLECVIESLVERWFEDAAIITNIIVAEKTLNANYTTKFIYLKKRLKDLFGAPPPASDVVANQRYYERISELFSKASNVIPTDGYLVQEDEDVRIVSVRKEMLSKIENELGKWGIIKGPKKYLEIIMKFLSQENVGLKKLGDVLDVDRGMTTNANEVFYLPSKYWTYLDETEHYLTLRGSRHKALKINKRYLRPLIRPAHIDNSTYIVSKLNKKKHEDYVLWIEDTSKVTDPAVTEYLKWAMDFAKQQNEIDSDSFPTLVGKIESSNWTQLPNKSGAKFFFKNDLHKSYAIYFNRMSEAQVDKRLFLGNSKVSVDERILFSVLNSVFTYLGMELIGRSNLGEGALDVNVVDYKGIPIVDPVRLRMKLEKENRLIDFLKVVDKVMEMKPADIESEARNENRLKMEQVVLGTLGFDKKDIVDFYRELITLVNLRVERATSYRKKPPAQSLSKR
jgi:type I restriction-modification system DNA methylase subunit